MLNIRLKILIVYLLGLSLVAVKCEQQRVKFKKIIAQDGSFKVEDEGEAKSMKILLAVIVKNHEHSLPTFLATLETLKCPNADKKCDLWLVFDNCKDESYSIFTTWLSSNRPLFDSILMINTDNDEKTKKNHPELKEAYFSKNLKRRALAYASDKKFDYLFFINADIILTNPNTVEILIKKKKTIVAPLLTSSETDHSTYWVNFETDEEFQSRFMPIYTRTKLGCFKVSGVQESFMIDLNDERISELINNQLPSEDDDVEFSQLATSKKILMHICNRENFGYVPDSIEDEKLSFTHLRIEHLLKGPNKTYNQPLAITHNIEPSKLVKKPTKLGFDEIYVINLERRVDRKQRIQSTLDDLQISYKIFNAVDGTTIDENYLKEYIIKPMPKYKDPYNDRPMNYGEIGCFMSHYLIWKDIVEKGHKKTLILEDDARFTLNFKPIITYLMDSLTEKNVQWELMYLGRKIMRDVSKEEFWNIDVPRKSGYGLVFPAYSHWTISYALTLEGAKKLLDAEPLKNLIPVDEYLPIMFNKQPNEYWLSFYPKRDVIALAVYPSIVNPTHYTGEPSHVSDTEETPIINISEDENETELELESDEILQKSRTEL